MRSPTTPAPALEVRNITKRFPGVLANDQISFTLNKGEIHALLGENGAGKSTLMNIIYGLYQQDEGEILVNGKQVEIRDPNDAIAKYNEACVLSLMSRKREALISLQDAVALDPRLLETAQGDSDLDNIRTETAFNEIVPPTVVIGH